MSAFEKGQLVISQTKWQGLEAGRVYAVTDVQETRTAFGNFATLTLDGRVQVVNSHLVLLKAGTVIKVDEAAPAAQAAPAAKPAAVATAPKPAVKAAPGEPAPPAAK